MLTLGEAETNGVRFKQNISYNYFKIILKIENLISLNNSKIKNRHMK